MGNKIQENIVGIILVGFVVIFFHYANSFFADGNGLIVGNF